MHRSPPTTSASIDDFRASDWKAAICISCRSSYFWRWNDLCAAAAAVAANGEGSFARAKVLWLLGDACSLRLDPQKLNEPLSATFKHAENSVSLTDRQFVDAVAVAMITPDPVVITAGFIGYLVSGFWGAVVAALATFFPCYLFTVLPAPYFKKYGKLPAIIAFVNGVTGQPLEPSRVL